MRKIENEESINDYKEYETDYKEMDKLTKDELIERYFYRIEKEIDSKMNTGVVVFIIFIAIIIILGLIIG